MKMKSFLLIVGFALTAAISPGAAAQPCGPGEVRTTVEIAGDELTLADLLGSGACPALYRAAAGVRLGRAPRGGSVRVIAGDEVRARFRQLAASSAAQDAGLRRHEITVPDRILVRPSGQRVSCAELGAEISAALAPPSVPSSGPASGTPGNLPDVQCGFPGSIPQGARIELLGARWDEARGSWQATARCRPVEACAPFLVRWPGGHQQQFPAGLPSHTLPAPLVRTESKHEIAFPGVRPGQRATLLWEQDGIRAVVPVVVLDRGEAGESVRARVGSGGQVLRAIVVSAGLLRVPS